jgi:RNA polymerase-binding transcription factor DksA
MAKKPVRKPAPAAAKKPSKPVAKKKPAPKPVSKAKTKPVAKKAAAPTPKRPAKRVAKPAPKRAVKTKVSVPSAPKRAVKSTPKPVPKVPPSKSVSKPVPAKPAAKAPAPVAPVKAAPAPVVKPVLKGKDAVRAKILAKRAKPAKPTAFSLDEVLAIAKTAEKTAAVEAPAARGPVIATKSGKVAPMPAHALQPVKPTTVKAASLADILGFNPKARTSHAENEEAAIPEKYKRYYRLLIELRNHVTGQVDQHSEETLKRSAKEDSGDLSSYGTDGGTDSFDRDFALSLVANEQEALAEIEAAIQRIKADNYGICEHTQKPISRERLIAVPFTRYTAEAMKEIEKTRYKVRGQTGILGEGEDSGGQKMDDGNDE